MACPGAPAPSPHCCKSLQIISLTPIVANHSANHSVSLTPIRNVVRCEYRKYGRTHRGTKSTSCNRNKQPRPATKQPRNSHDHPRNSQDHPRNINHDQPQNNNHNQPQSHQTATTSHQTTTTSHEYCTPEGFAIQANLLKDVIISRCEELFSFPTMYNVWAKS